jgi:pilus assembly protein CpaB
LLLAAAAGVMWANLAAHNGSRHSSMLTSHAPAAAITILVGTTEIPRGRLLSAQDFSLKLVDPTKAPAAALHHAEDAQGHMALAPIAAGAPILSGQISADAVAGLAARIPEFHRAYAVAVSEADIAGGLIQAGDRVDLYVTLPGALFADTSGKKPDDRSKAALLLQSVEVLAVGGKLKSDGSANPAVRTVTLALSAADLAKVALATHLGTITFAIRNPVDDKIEPASRAELASLLGEEPANVDRAQEHAKPGYGVTLYAGRNRTTLHLP